MRRNYLKRSRPLKTSSIKKKYDWRTSQAFDPSTKISWTSHSGSFDNKISSKWNFTMLMSVYTLTSNSVIEILSFTTSFDPRYDADFSFPWRSRWELRHANCRVTKSLMSHFVLNTRTWYDSPRSSRNLRIFTIFKYRCVSVSCLHLFDLSIVNFLAFIWIETEKIAEKDPALSESVVRFETWDKNDFVWH